MNFTKLMSYFRPRAKGIFKGRARTCDDTALLYRMGAGFPGSVNRTHPASIEAVVLDTTNPPTAFGQPIVIDGTSHNARKIITGDNTLDAIYGILVRPFPTQQFKDTVGNGAIGIGAAGPQQVQPSDVLRSGYIMGLLNVAGAVKGGRVYIWAAATNGAHVQGGFEVAASATNTILLDEKTYYNGPEDANLNVEIAFNI